MTFPVDDHLENWPVRSRRFRIWLSGRHHGVHKAAPGGQAIEDALRVIEFRAIYEGAEYPTFLRIGGDDGTVYFDLGRKEWSAVEITANGWRIVHRPPIKFVRSPQMRPLPIPEHGELVDRLRDLINYGSEANFRMAAAFLVGACRARGPYPILVIQGEAGSAKSGFARFLRRLLDPNVAPIRTAPKKEDDLIVEARNSWILAYDNISTVPADLADALCRLSTGAGLGKRAFYTEWDSTAFGGSRPVIVTGIDGLVSRSDLADRALLVTLPPIPSDQRQLESRLDAAFEEAAPGLLGAVFDAASAAIRRFPETELSTKPRMADFATWITAAEPGLGWEDGSFLKYYEANRQEAMRTSAESNYIALAIQDLVASGPYCGTASALLEALEARVDDNIRRSRFWPRNPGALGKQLSRLATSLKAFGIEITRGKGGPNSERWIEIRMKEPISAAQIADGSSAN